MGQLTAELTSAVTQVNAHPAITTNASPAVVGFSTPIGGPGGAPAFEDSSSLREQRFMAAGARTVGRMSAAAISQREQDELLQERQRLLDKKFSGTITRSEANRLSYVRWTLDRIEDARYGPVLDQFEAKLSLLL